MARLRVSRGYIAPAFASCKLEMEPLFVVPSFVSGPQSDICQDDIDGAVPQAEPSRLDSGRTIKPQQSGHLLTVVFATGTLHNGVTPEAGHGTFVCRKATSIGEVRRSPSLDDVSLSTALLNSPVSTTAPSLRQQQQRDAHRTSFSAFVFQVDVRDSKLRARLVGCPAELAGNRHTFKSP